MASSQNDGVLVVGAGPTGLTMAILLMMQGVPTRIIDEKAQYSTSSRGTGVQARQLELLSFIGCDDEVLENATPPFAIRIYASPDGVNPVRDFEWSPSLKESPSIPFRSIASTSQASLEAALRKRLQALGGCVELSTSLVGLREGEDYVAAETIHWSPTGEPAATVTRKYASVVAADGAKGRIRSMVGVNYLGETRKAERMFIADIIAHGLDGEHWHRWGDMSNLSCFLKPMVPFPQFQLQSIGPQLPEILPSNIDELQKFFSGISGRHDIGLSDMTWSTAWRANIRMVDMFSKGNVHFIGDAAHCHSPAGGQGVVTGMTDAFNLAWKLALAYRGLASEALLPSYQSERMPVVANMLSLTNALHARTIGAQPQTAGNTSQSAARDPMYRDNALSQLWVNYRWSSIVTDERFPRRTSEEPHMNPFGVEGDTLRAGDRAPDATSLREVDATGAISYFETTLFKIYSPAVHTLIVFPGNKFLAFDLEFASRYRAMGILTLWIIIPSGQTVGGVAADKIFVDAAGHARSGYGLSSAPADSETHYFLVRPDGMIGAYGTGPGSVQEYFRNILRSDD